MASRSWAEILSVRSSPRGRIRGRQFILCALIAPSVFLGVTASAFAVPLSPDQKDGIMTRCLIAGGTPKVCCAASDDTFTPNACAQKREVAATPESKPVAAQPPAKSKTSGLDFSKMQEGPAPGELTK